MSLLPVAGPNRTKEVVFDVSCVTALCVWWQEYPVAFCDGPVKQIHDVALQPSHKPAQWMDVATMCFYQHWCSIKDEQHIQFGMFWRLVSLKWKANWRRMLAWKCRNVYVCVRACVRVCVYIISLQASSVCSINIYTKEAPYLSSSERSHVNSLFPN